MTFIDAITKASSVYEAIIYPEGERDDHAYRVKAGQIRLVGSSTYSIPVKDFLERDWVVEEVSE